ncbi:hypothetical protein [Streptomyces formicae]|uniref:Uncharacterized protein n=1 Tax=Streptomyces formicae TaxID=1616117 RepID=A0ABY3WCJ3_9ACTN|nr:hypothetical protein [Streptomyces formicae]UNM10289.1 hypothetical protein J4032_01080 [Streptomyces formicae]
MAEKAGRQRSGTTKAAHPVQATLAHPMETMTAVVDRVPGVDRVKNAFDGVLDSVGVVSPHARRVTAYAGAGLLGVAGVIEWPVAVAGAAVVWLTQPRAKEATSQGSRAAASGNGMRAKQAARSAKASTASTASTTSTTATASRKPKPAVKSSSKSTAKPTAKSPSKSTAKSSSKASAKPSAKVSAKSSPKSSAKSSAKKAPTTAGRSRTGPSAQRSSARKTASAGRKKS